MRIIYLTDIHGSFDRLMDLLYETVADVYIIGGDLIDIPFYNMDTAIRYHELQTYFNGLRRRLDKEDVILEDLVDSLLEMPDVPEEIQDKGTKYQQYTIRARRVMQQKYKVLENIISIKQNSLLFCLPGNYDMDLRFTSLHERDLHKKKYHIGDIIISGYGGADIWTAGIPEKYIVKYKGGIGVEDRNNELYKFFKETEPDIIVSHQPAYGIHDRLKNRGPSGSPALRTYIDNHEVMLCLSGHIHREWGFDYQENTIYLNPSNFGEVIQLHGDVSEGGFFYSIEIEENKVTKVIFKKLVDRRIYDIADYFIADGKWKEVVIDGERYDTLKKGDNYDLARKKYSNIPEIRLFNEIKEFFRTFQTYETDIRVDKLEQITLELNEKNNQDIAMDVVGSVNIGISQPSSDIDFVLYLRCDESCKELAVHCNQYKMAEKMIHEAMGDEYVFEIIDCIDLNRVEKSIREKNYECDVTQRFVAYRSFCRPINYRLIAPIEDMLNEDIEYRQELEGSIRSYFKIFVTTSRHVKSFDKYESRLKSIGIRLPEAIRNKIKKYLNNEHIEDIF